MFSLQGQVLGYSYRCQSWGGLNNHSGWLTIYGLIGLVGTYQVLAQVLDCAAAWR